MNQFEKNEILKQVGSILQFCQNIVSRLSSSTSAPEVNNNEELIETIASFGDKEEEADDDRDGDDLWWDSSSPPPQFYTLVFDDDDVSLYSLDDSYADFLLPSDMLEDPPEMSKDVTMQANESRDMMRMSENVLMHSVLQFLHVATPNAIYRPNWRQEEAKKLIHPVFYNLWNHCDSIFTEEKDDDTPKMAEPADIYHTIDLSCVNARFLQNIPKPNHYPVLGVSQDPDFYHKWYPKEDTTKHFLKSFPHGALYGYETNIGIVAPPTEPIHGYIWSERYGSFVLHAVQPGERTRSSCRRRG